MKLKIVLALVLAAAVFVGALRIVSASQKSPTVKAAVPAEEAYAKLKDEIQTLEQSLQTERSTVRRVEIVEKIEVMLTEFVESYPGTPEAADASFQLGIVCQSLQKSDRAVTYLNDFLAAVPDAADDKRAFARFFLAEAYRATGDYDAARREYNVIIEKYSATQPTIAQRAGQNLASLDSDQKLAVGNEPISFSVTGIDGETISPEKYRGKVLLLDFWATWCGPCKQEMPNVKRVYSKYNKKGFEIVGISLDRSRADLDTYIEKNGITWPQFYDGKFWKNDVAVKYNVQSIPATYLIDKKGKIRYKSLRGNQLEPAVKKLLEE